MASAIIPANIISLLFDVRKNNGIPRNDCNFAVNREKKKKKKALKNVSAGFSRS